MRTVTAARHAGGHERTSRSTATSSSPPSGRSCIPSSAPGSPLRALGQGPAVGAQPGVSAGDVATSPGCGVPAERAEGAGAGSRARRPSAARRSPDEASAASAPLTLQRRPHALDRPRRRRGLGAWVRPSGARLWRERSDRPSGLSGRAEHARMMGSGKGVPGLSRRLRSLPTPPHSQTNLRAAHFLAWDHRHAPG
jgi:hypothetical protein